MNINLKGAYNCCKAVLRPMMKQRYGRIVNITSVVGLSGNAGQTNYSASKAGLIGFTKSLAKEVGSRNITVNAVAPGYITTAPDRCAVRGVQSKPPSKQPPWVAWAHPRISLAPSPSWSRIRLRSSPGRC